jgi:hypothetical protein
MKLIAPPIPRSGAVVAIIAVLVLATGVAEAKKKGEFFIQRAHLTKQDNGSWSGPGTLDGVKGTVTITGTVVLLEQEFHTIHWRWVAGSRRVAGCSVNEVLTRPHGIQLWDGGGRITSTSAKERKYRGRHVALYGPTRRDDLTHAQISIGEYEPSSEFPAQRCR